MESPHAKHILSIHSPFPDILDNYFLAREELIALYDSRQPTLVLFDTIDPPRYHCSYGFKDPIPKVIAYGLYGANIEVTLLELISGTTVVLDGGRCYPIWKMGVEKAEIHPIAVLYVIKETRSLNDIQRLQLATYCNIKSRETRMNTFWERIQVTFAFYSVFMDRYEETKTGDGGSILHKQKRTKDTITNLVGKALYSALLFDEEFPPEVQARGVEYLESLVRLTVRSCLQLSVEKRLLEAVKYLCREAPSYAKTYFNRQFVYDFQAPWFHSAPLVKQILLMFSLPSLPYYSQMWYEHGDMYSVALSENEHPANIRTRMRACLPSICDKVSSFLFKYAFRALENSEDIHYHASSKFHWHSKQKADFDLPFIGEVAFQIVQAARKAENDWLCGHITTGEEAIEEFVLSVTEEEIKKYSLIVHQNKLYLLLN